MRNDDHNLTREDYRKQRAQQETDFEQRDRKRVQVEKEYARTHEQGPIDAEDDPLSSRSQTKQGKPAGERSLRWKRRLNWAIFWLVGLIILTYVILFFVG